MTLLRPTLLALALALVSPLAACAKGADTGGAGGEDTTATGTSVGGHGGAGGAGCTPDVTEDCYAGPKGTDGVGLCKAGKHTCNADGSGYGSCEGMVLPNDEDCATPEDEDCDGEAPLCPGAAIWAERFGDASNQRLLGMAVDGTGAVFLTGFFAGSVDFDGQVITSAGGSDIFVAKLDPTGKPLWAKRFGDEKEQYGNAVAVDSSGNVYVTGEFDGKVNFGTAELQSAGSTDAFLAKLDGGSGTQLWAKRFGDQTAQSGHGVAVDGTDAVVITGSMEGTTNFGGLNLTSGGGADAFVAKFQGSGIHAWSQRFGDLGGGSQSGQAVATDATGNAYVTGSYVGTIVFGANTVMGGGGADVFVAKLDAAAGNVVWANGYGAASDQLARSIAADGSGNVVVTGSFQGQIDFGGASLSTSGADDVFVAELDASGAHVWSQKFGDSMAQVGRSVAVDASGNVVVTGGFAGSVDFGGGKLTTKGGDDFFVARFDPTGAHLSSASFGDASDQTAQAAAVDADGNVLVAGDLKGSIDFGGGTLKSAGYFDIVVAKFAP